MNSQSPTVAHGAFVKMLRELRQAARYDYADAAAELGVNTRTIKRWEDGTNIPSRSSIKFLGTFYGATHAQVEALCSLARDAKQTGLVEKFKGGAPPEFRTFAEHEASAISILMYEPELIPGLAQTTDYLREIHETYLDFLIPNPRAIHAFRQNRQKRVFSRRHLPEIKMVIGIAAMLYLDALPDDVKSGQVQRLRELNAESSIDIKVVTLPHTAMGGGFTIMTPAKDGHGASRFAYLESQDAGRYVEDSDTLSLYAKIFRSVYGRAIPLEEYLHGR